MTPARARGRLRIVLGAAPGAGKTYAMLAEGQRLAAEGADVVVAYATTHHRRRTDELLGSLQQVPLKHVAYRGTSFDELDTDAVIARRPEIALVDEFAHTNVPGAFHVKRWQDVEEIRDAGIDVITTMNVQHIDSLNAAVAAVTGVAQHETVPDTVVAAADAVELIDVDPAALRQRVASSDVFEADMAQAALGVYFTTEHLAALRGLALDWLDAHDLPHESVGADATAGPVPPGGGGRVVAALTGSPEGESVLRRAAQLAAGDGGEFIGVHATTPSGSAEPEPVWLEGQRRLLVELGGRYVEIAADDVATAVVEFAVAEGAGQLVLGATRRSRLQELFHGSVINRAIRHAGTVEVHVVPARHATAAARPTARGRAGRRRVPLPLRRRQVSWAFALAAPAVVTVGLSPFHTSIGLAGALFCTLVAVVGAAALGGLLPAGLATIVGFVLADFFYAPPLHSLRIDRLIDLIALVAFAVVSVIVGGLVDVLARQGLRSARAQSAAENLARVVADVVVGTPEALGELAATVRRAFDLTAVSVLSRQGTGWRVDAEAGRRAPQTPEEATRALELPDHRVLAVLAVGGGPLDTRPLDAFVAELRHAGERHQLDALRRSGGTSPQTGDDAG
jgi:two-component system sensor histidine kinase KdpD